MARISREQKARNRERIVAAASARFRAEGVGEVGIAELMRGAGLTHGGFYNHFASKDELAAVVCEDAFAGVAETLARVLAAEGPGALDALLDGYLSAAHRDAADGGCPSAALAGDARRLGDGVAEAFARGIEAFLDGVADALERRGVTDPAERRAQAVATLSGMVGAMVLARAVAGARPGLSDELLAGTRAAQPSGGGGARPASITGSGTTGTSASSSVRTPVTR
jgi:TetR/AcrR family transcriptional repressor of nem operon